MVRLLALVLLAVLIWLLLDWLYTKAMGSLGLHPRSGRKRDAARRPGSSPAGRSEPLVRCGSCGTYIPASRALPVGRSRAGRDERIACSEICRHRLRTGAGGPNGATGRDAAG